MTAELDPRRWKILAVLIAAAFMDLLDVTIVNVALPSMREDLHASTATLEWVAAGYQLSFALVLITGGRLGDVLGRKKIFLLGMIGFVIASLGCGLAPTPGLLITMRILQGAGAALMVPQTTSVLQAVFPPSERAKAFGVFGGSSGLAAISGPILGGVIVDADLGGSSWRPIFLLNVPVGMLLFWLGTRLVPESRSATAERLDLSGAATVTVGLLLLVYPLVQGRELGWPAWTFVSMAASPVVLLFFYRQQQARTASHASPLMVTSLFGSRGFTAGLATTLCVMGCISGFFFVFTLTLQIGVGFSPTRSGFTGIPFSALVSVGAGVGAAVLAPRFGRRVLTAGSLIFLLGVIGIIWTLNSAGPGVTSWDLVPALAVSGLGFGLVVAPLFDIALSQVPVDDAGSASGLLGMTQQVGGALAVAVLGVIFFDPIPHLAQTSAERAVPRLQARVEAAGLSGPEAAALTGSFVRCARAQSLNDDPSRLPDDCRPPGSDAPAPVVAAQRIVADEGQRVRAETFIDAATPALWTAAGLLALCALSTRWLPRRAPTAAAGVRPAPA